ncbi:MAG: NAD(+) synthase [Longimicrobiales bacterium]|nr:NAD(+) synthase [Longimicrobiales bacterium]
MTRPDPHAPLRLALAQFHPAKARVDENLGRIREIVADHAGESDLLVFPEASLSGYFLQGGVSELARTTAWVADRLGPPPEGAPDLVLGFFEAWRQRVYNAAVLFTPHADTWAVAHVHRKLFLPTYGVFDEERFVEAGTEVRPVETRHGRIGLLVCEDAWHGLTSTILALHGAELIVIPSASPARDFRPDETSRPRNLVRWERVGRSIAEEHGVFVGIAQLVGSEGGKVFVGGSQLFGPDGECLADAGLHDERVVSVRLPGGAIARARAETPLLADLEHALPHLWRALGSPPQEADGVWGGARREAPYGAVPPAPTGLRGAAAGSGPIAGPDPDTPVETLLALDLELVETTLVRFLRDEVVGRRGFEGVVIGVSGGVDSAVTLALACRALGPEQVHGFRLPYRTSSPESLAHAAAILEQTGAHERTIEISEAVDGYTEVHEPDASPLRRGNVMARMRSIVLFDQSARLGALPLGTGNKSERLLGYYTWHADDSPPINPLGDLFKTQVWALARHLGVPPEIVDKPATADLVEGVTDETEIGVSYREADPILYWLTRGWLPGELVEAGFDATAVELVARRLDGTHWKRERPTVALLSSTAIGESYLRPVDY